MFYLFCLSSLILLKANSWPRCRRLIFSLLINRLCFKFINAGDRIFEHIFVSANICLSVTGKENKDRNDLQVVMKQLLLCIGDASIHKNSNCLFVPATWILLYCNAVKGRNWKKFRDFEWGRDRVFFSTSSVAAQLNQTKLCVIAAL